MPLAYNQRFASSALTSRRGIVQFASLVWSLCEEWSQSREFL